MPRGFTLLEFLVVLLIIGIISSVAIPNFSTSNQFRLDHAALEVATGLRHARDEAIRTGDIHAFKIDSHVSVYQVDLSAADPTLPVAYLLHPLSKQFYPFVLTDLIGSQGISLTQSTPFSFVDGATTTDVVFFDEMGMPFYMDSSRIFKYYSSGTVSLASGNAAKSIQLEAGYGRVIIQ